MEQFKNISSIKQHYEYGDDWFEYYVFVSNENWKEEVKNFLDIECCLRFVYRNEILELNQKYVMIVEPHRQCNCDVKFIKLSNFINNIKEKFDNVLNLLDGVAKE